MTSDNCRAERVRRKSIGVCEKKMQRRFSDLEESDGYSRPFPKRSLLRLRLVEKVLPGAKVISAFAEEFLAREYPSALSRNLQGPGLDSLRASFILASRERFFVHKRFLFTFHGALIFPAILNPFSAERRYIVAYAMAPYSSH